MFRQLFAVFILAALAGVHPLAQNAAPKSDAKAAKPAVVVNLNTATAADLEQLPGIGAKTAARIVEYRQKKGPFKKIEELMNVQGVGEKSFLRIRAQLSVAEHSPANQ